MSTYDRRRNEKNRRRKAIKKSSDGMDNKRQLSPEELELRRIRREEMRKKQVRADFEKKRRGKSLKSKKALWKRIALGVLIALILIVSIVTFNIVGLLNSIQTADMIAAKEVPMNSTVNVLILGMDIGDSNQVENEEIKRTDTIIVLNYNPETKKAHLVNIPRDTLINVNGQNAKINAAMIMGGEELLQKEIEKMLSIEINYQVKIDYKAFREIIDAIGGVEMYIDRNMKYTDKKQGLKIRFKKGETVHLDGKKAEEFFRWRKNNDGTGFAMGDLDRIKNQQKLLKKVMEKMTSPSIIFKAQDILKAVRDNVKTNMPGGRIAKYGLKFVALDSDDIIMTTIKGEPEYIDGISYVIFDREANMKLIKALNSSSGAFDKVEKKDVKIMVLNSTNVSGLAAKLQGDIKSLGYQKVDVGNIEERDKSVVMIAKDNIEKLFKNDFNQISNFSGKDESLGYSDYDVVIIIGNDYI